MGRALRFFESDGYYFVTARAFQSRMLLKPSRQMEAVIGGILAKASRLTNVRLLGFVAASNHLHLLVHARGADLTRFMQFTLCNVSKKAGALVAWRGQFWQRRYSAEPVLDERALEKRLEYILGHGVKENLVEHVSEWPGLSCLPQLLGDATRTFPFYEWAKRWKGGKLVPGGADRWSRAWVTEEQLELHPLPMWSSWSLEQRKARIRRMVAAIEAKRRKTRRKVAGLDAVMRQEALAPPAASNRSPRPWCHASSKKAAAMFMQRYRVFARAFQRASDLFRLGQWNAEFPPLAFRPWVPARI